MREEDDEWCRMDDDESGARMQREDEEKRETGEMSLNMSLMLGN